MSVSEKSSQARSVEDLIRMIRGQRVILDADLAQAYGVSTKQLNQAVRRNSNRFPSDFAFRLEPQELANLRSQFVTSSSHGGRRRLPYAFTEHGAIMAANVLKSSRAIRMSVFVVRAFVKMRETLSGNPDLAQKLVELEQKLTSRLDTHEQAILHLIEEIRARMEPSPAIPEPARRQIGFHAKPDPGASGAKACR